MKRTALFALVFACGFAICWFYRDYAEEQHQKDYVPRDAYVRMTTQSMQNLDSFMQSLNRINELEAELKAARAKKY